MKPLLIVLAILCTQFVAAQNIDYLSVRKKNGRVVKNFYTSSRIVLQLADYSYLQGVIERIKNDSLFVMVYDVRMYPTPWGGFVRDTITQTLIGLRPSDIRRVQIAKKQPYLKRVSGPLLLLAGGSYLALNALNGTFFDGAVPGEEKRRTLAIGGGIFGLGFLFQRLFRWDGFSNKHHRIQYVSLQRRPA